MTDYGINSQTDVSDNLVAGAIKKMPVLIDAAVATASRGQVLEWDASGNNFVKYTSASTKMVYVVLAEDIDISADGYAEAYVTGSDLNLNSLDATAKADDEIVAAMLKSGIIVRESVNVE